MLYYDKIDISEGIEANITSELKEYNTCHYLYFLEKGSDVCTGFHDVLKMSIILLF